MLLKIPEFHEKRTHYTLLWTQIKSTYVASENTRMDNMCYKICQTVSWIFCSPNIVPWIIGKSKFVMLTHQLLQHEVFQCHRAGHLSQWSTVGEIDTDQRRFLAFSTWNKFSIQPHISSELWFFFFYLQISQVAALYNTQFTYWIMSFVALNI